MARDNPISRMRSVAIIHWVSLADILSGYVEPALIGAVTTPDRIPETVPMMNRIPTITVVFLYVFIFFSFFERYG
jgi:hypothetical protein